MHESSSESHPEEAQPIAKASLVDLTVSPPEKTSGLLLAGIAAVGLLTVLLFSMWAWPEASKMPRISSPSPPTTVAGGNLGTDAEPTFETPQPDEFSDVSEPNVSRMVTDLTSTVTLVSLALGNLPTTQKGEGDDDKCCSRQAGPDIDGEYGPEILPRHLRWKLIFTAANVGEYAKQLDELLIELGVLGGGMPGVDYACQFSGQIQTRQGDPAQEKRLYFRWHDGNKFRSFDHQLLRTAGIPAERRIVAMFLSADLENEMAIRELEWATKAGVPSVAQIAETVFEVRPEAGRFQFQVISQRLRLPTSPTTVD